MICALNQMPSSSRTAARLKFCMRMEFYSPKVAGDRVLQECRPRDPDVKIGRGQRALQTVGDPAFYLRPLKIAADFIVLIEMQLAGYPGNLARTAGRTRAQRGHQAVGIETKRIQAV